MRLYSVEQTARGGTIRKFHVTIIVAKIIAIHDIISIILKHVNMLNTSSGDYIHLNSLLLSLNLVNILLFSFAQAVIKGALLMFSHCVTFLCVLTEPILTNSITLKIIW